MNSILQTIKERRSTRKFKSDQIDEQSLEAIVEAGLYAPSAHNQQSWHFTVIQNLDLLNELSIETKNVGKTIPDDMVQKISNNDKFNIFYHAPTVIIVSGDEAALMPKVDCAAASQNMLIAAESLDIGSCWVGYLAMLFRGPKGDDYKTKLNIPSSHTPYYAIALGYKDHQVAQAPARKENRAHFIK